METAKPQGLLANKNVVYLLSAQLFSAIGDGIFLLAILALFGIQKEASPMEMAYITLALGLPFVIFGPLTGVLADKFDRKKIMILSDLARCVLMLAVAVTNEAWLIYVLLFLKGVFESLFTPAKNGKLKEYVPNEQMDQIVSISTIIDYGSKIVGPAVGGVLVAATSIQLAFYLDAASFLISAMFLMGLSKRTVPVETSQDKKDESFLLLFKNGLSFIRKTPALMYGAIAFSIAMLVLTLTDTQLVVLMRQLSGVSMSLFGVVMGAIGLGTLAVAAMLSKAKIKGAILYMSLGCLGTGGAFFCITLFTKLQLIGQWLWYPAFGLVGGCFAALVFVPFQVMAQKLTPESYTSRVFGVIGSLSTFATIVGPLMGGVLIDLYGVFAIYYIVSGLLVLTSVLLAVLHMTDSRKKTEQVVMEGFDGR
ncbi:MFS transporter [Paenibacillus sp. UMB4589-SE434]|uniref:MFS transporter n=1 Tax=Paenibacillus sp. UMB4589-SE434 TaxID=3046314 RepID=UPI002549D180|nr:MFS transporter [Paenibacillus sp. UMB4589-SE434]MDK8182708.1 MFS transporter [Paenibacillus sp. UMB4589-SE434]